MLKSVSYAATRHSYIYASSLRRDVPPSAINVCTPSTISTISDSLIKIRQALEKIAPSVYGPLTEQDSLTLLSTVSDSYNFSSSLIEELKTLLSESPSACLQSIEDALNTLKQYQVLFRNFNQLIEAKYLKNLTAAKTKPGPASYWSLLQVLEKLPLELRTYKPLMQTLLDKFLLNGLDGTVRLEDLLNVQKCSFELKAFSSSHSSCQLFLDLFQDMQQEILSAIVKRAQAIENLYTQYQIHTLSPSSQWVKESIDFYWTFNNPFELSIRWDDFLPLYQSLEKKSQSLTLTPEKLSFFKGIQPLICSIAENKRPISNEQKEVLFKAKIDTLVACRLSRLAACQRAPSILVEGGGPIGQIYALIGFLEGAKVQIIDKKEKAPWQHSYTREDNALLLDTRYVASVFKFLGLDEEIKGLKEIAHPKHTELSYYTTSIASLEKAIRYILEELKKKCPGWIDIISGEVIDLRVASTLHTQVLVRTNDNSSLFFSPDILIGAGGTKSSIKSRLGIENKLLSTRMQVLVTSFEKKQPFYPIEMTKQIYYLALHKIAKKRNRAESFLDVHTPTSAVTLAGLIEIGNKQKKHFGFLPLKSTFETELTSVKDPREKQKRLEKEARKAAAWCGILNANLTSAHLFTSQASCIDENAILLGSSICLLVGDAASTATPESGAGARQAIYSGRLFAKCLRDYCQKRDHSEVLMIQKFRYGMEDLQHRQLIDSLDARKEFREGSETEELFLSLCVKNGDLSQEEYCSARWLLERKKLTWPPSSQDFFLACQLKDKLKEQFLPAHIWDSVIQKQLCKFQNPSEYLANFARASLAQKLTEIILHFRNSSFFLAQNLFFDLHENSLESYLKKAFVAGALDSADLKKMQSYTHNPQLNYNKEEWECLDRLAKKIQTLLPCEIGIDETKTPMTLHIKSDLSQILFKQRKGILKNFSIPTEPKGIEEHFKEALRTNVLGINEIFKLLEIHLKIKDTKPLENEENSFLWALTHRFQHFSFCHDLTVKALREWIDSLINSSPFIFTRAMHASTEGPDK